MTTERKEAMTEAWDWFTRFNEKAKDGSYGGYSVVTTKVTAPAEVWVLVKEMAEWILNVDALVRKVFDDSDD